MLIKKRASDMPACKRASARKAVRRMQWTGHASAAARAGLETATALVHTAVSWLTTGKGMHPTKQDGPWRADHFTLGPRALPCTHSRTCDVEVRPRLMAVMVPRTHQPKGHSHANVDKGGQQGGGNGHAHLSLEQRCSVRVTLQQRAPSSACPPLPPSLCCGSAQCSAHMQPAAPRQRTRLFTPPCVTDSATPKPDGSAKKRPTWVAVYGKLPIIGNA